MVPSSNPSAEEMREESEIQGHPQLYREVEASLDHMMLSQKANRKKGRKREEEKGRHEKKCYVFVNNTEQGLYEGYYVVCSVLLHFLPFPVFLLSISTQHFITMETEAFIGSVW